MLNKLLYFVLGTVTAFVVMYFIPNEPVSEIVIEKSDELVTPTSVGLLSVEWFDTGVVAVQGGWKTDIELVNNKNSVSIMCQRTTAECIMAQADIIDGYFTNDISYYEIQSWDTESGILAASQDSSVCDEQLLQLGPDSVRLYENRKSDAPEEFCPSDKKSVVLELTNLSNEI